MENVQKTVYRKFNGAMRAMRGKHYYRPNEEQKKKKSKKYEKKSGQGNVTICAVTQSHYKRNGHES